MKVVVVEDEMKSLKGLQALVRSLGQEWEVVGSAVNGQEGLEVVKHTNPDIIITDIMMPKVDGLEMIQNIYKQQIACKFIILSGYADFKYAQAAIKLGGVDYLLKPITKNSLKASLEKVRDMILEERKQIQPSRFSMQELWERISSVSQEAAEEYLQELSARIPAGKKLYLLLLKGDNSFTSGEIKKWKEIMGYYLSGYSYYSFSQKKNEYFFLIEIGDRVKLETRLLEAFEQRESDVAFSSCIMEEVHEFYQAVNKVEDNSNWNLSGVKWKIICDEEISKVRCKQFVYPSEIEKEVIQKIGRLEIEEIRKDLQRFVSYLKDQPYHYKDVREAMMCMTVSVLYEIRKSSYGIYQEISHLNILDWVKNRIFTGSYSMVIMNLLTDFKKSKENIHHCDNLIVNKVLHMIEKEFKENILLEEMARRFSITPEYLSALFIRELGIKYTTYCTQVKIEHAKQLLREGRWKIYQIAEQSGYTDVKYFCKVFKKYTGKSQSENNHP